MFCGFWSVLGESTEANDGCSRHLHGAAQSAPPAQVALQDCQREHVGLHIACARTLDGNIVHNERRKWVEEASGWAGQLLSEGVGERASERRGPFFVINGQDILWPLSPISFSEERGDIAKRGV